MTLYIIVGLALVLIVGVLYILKFKKDDDRSIMEETPHEIQPEPTPEPEQKKEVDSFEQTAEAEIKQEGKEEEGDSSESQF